MEHGDMQINKIHKINIVKQKIKWNYEHEKMKN